MIAAFLPRRCPINERSYPRFRGHGTCSSFPTTVWVSRIARSGAYQPERSYLARCRAGTHAHVHATARRHTLVPVPRRLSFLLSTSPPFFPFFFFSFFPSSPFSYRHRVAVPPWGHGSLAGGSPTVEKFQGEIEIDRESTPNPALSDNGFP